MATRIESTAVAIGGLRSRTSARRLADEASTAAMTKASISPEDVGLLLNAGLYRDRNLGEPALAALIQEDVGSNPEDPHEGRHGTFSFDVANGGCGVLTALQIADGFLRARTIEHALVVASDANPGHRMAPSFPFSATGAAVVCGWDDKPTGLAGFRFEKAPDEHDAFRSTVGFDGSHNRLRIEEHADFGMRAALLAEKVSVSLLADHGVRPWDVDLVIASPQTPSFLETLSSRLDCPQATFVVVDGAERAHTAALLVALEAAESSGRLAGASRVLLVSAGAGIVAGAALLLGA